MAEDEGKSGKSRFLSKSKWGKVFKEKENEEYSNGKTNSFKLNEDVSEFLKPSTDKAAAIASTRQQQLAPKIDIAIAQRWPDAHQVRQASAGTPSSANTFSSAAFNPANQAIINRHVPRRRREGLAVGFVKTPPEIIGEGGDDALEPPTEVSRQKAMMPRSVSDRRPSPLPDGRPWPGTDVAPPRQAKVSTQREENFRPPPVRRAQTSHNEFSPPLQSRMSPPTQPPEPRPGMLARAPTGFNSQDQLFSPEDDESPAMPQARPSVETRFGEARADSGYSQTPQTAASHSSGGSRLAQPPQDLHTSPVAVKEHDMRHSEGMALRRASTLLQNGRAAHEDEEVPEDPITASQNTLQNIQIPIQPSVKTSSYDSHSAPSSGLSPPESALSPEGPSPFADPRYTKRHSRETSPAPPIRQPQAPAAKQSREPYQPSYMQNLQPSNEQLQPQTYQMPLARHARQASTEQPSSMRSSLDQQQPQQRRRAPSDVNERSSGQSQQPSYASTQQAPTAHSASRQQPQQPAQVQQDARRTRADDQPSYMRAIQPPESSMLPTRPAPAPGSSQKMSVPQDSSRDRSRSPMRDRIFGVQPMEKPAPFYSRPNGSCGSLNRFPPSPRTGHSRTSSRDGDSPQLAQSAGSAFQPPPSPRLQTYGESPQSNSPRSTLLGPSAASKQMQVPYSRGPTPDERSHRNDYFSAPRSSQGQPARSPAANLRQEESVRPGSSSSSGSAHRPAPSPQPPIEGNPAGDAALVDFAARVAHMKGVFRLTAEKEQPAEHCTPRAWLRAGLWWFVRGKAGLETQLQQRPRSDGQPRELLTQAHVDLAKAWWILSDQLEQYDMLDSTSPQSAHANESAEAAMKRSCAVLRSHLKSLWLSMKRNAIMPPHQSLIQGQDTQIWLEYPRFTADAASVLGGNVSSSLIVEKARSALDPLGALPLGDTNDMHCYGRFAVNVSLRTEEADTDRVELPCTLSMLRGKQDYQMTIVIASQSELVNIRVGPRRGQERALTWSDASWKASSLALLIHLPRGFDLTIRFQERDYRSLWNMAEYTRKVEHCLRAEQGEMLAHEAHLAELQYADSSNPNAFPPEKIRGCVALVYERHEELVDGSGRRKMHRGYRLLLVTDPGHKTLSCVSHELCRRGPLLFEFLTDAAAQGTTAMVIRVREDSRQCRMLLVFRNADSRQDLYDIVNGMNVKPDETIVGKMSLTGLSIVTADQSVGIGSALPTAGLLQSLQWQKLGVTNSRPDDPNSRLPETVHSEALRVVARHTTGCITDRLNLGKGELLLRLPCMDIPAVQLLRSPQEDLTMSIDTRHSPQNVADGITELLDIAQQQSTIRTFTFANSADLHAFQAAITGFTVRYDGIASTFGIARRMMYVPIAHKWQATKVRLQVVANAANTLWQVMAFMEDFTHADAMCFQVKSTDTFEAIKGNSKDKKWAIKMVDSKFSLPPQEKEDIEDDVKVRRRFVNLEGLNYAEEHDDITIGFESEEDRDRFGQALPAATTVGRNFTLKRRI